jgi:hypothetical protein
LSVSREMSATVSPSAVAWCAASVRRHAAAPYAAAMWVGSAPSGPASGASASSDPELAKITASGCAAALAQATCAGRSRVRPPCHAAAADHADIDKVDATDDSDDEDDVDDAEVAEVAEVAEDTDAVGEFADGAVKEDPEDGPGGGAAPAPWLLAGDRSPVVARTDPGTPAARSTPAQCAWPRESMEHA